MVVEKTETSVRFDEIKLNAFKNCKLPKVRLYGLVLTARKLTNPKGITRLLVTDLTTNPENCFKAGMHNREYSFKANKYVEPEQKFAVDVWAAKFAPFNQLLERNFNFSFPTHGTEFSSNVFEKKILVEISANLKPYNNQLDISQPVIVPLTPELLEKRAILEKDETIISFLNRLKVVISHEWLETFDEYYGYSKVMERLSTFNSYMNHPIESQLPTQPFSDDFNKRRRLDFDYNPNDPSSALVHLIPNIKREIVNTSIISEDPSDNERDEATFANRDDDLIHSTSTPSMSEQVHAQAQAQTQLINSNNLSFNPTLSISEVISQSTQKVIDMVQLDVVNSNYWVDIVAFYPAHMTKLKSIYTKEVIINESLELFVKYSPGDIIDSSAFKPIGNIKFNSEAEISSLGDLADITNYQLKIPRDDWLNLFSLAKNKLFIYWNEEWTLRKVPSSQ